MFRISGRNVAFQVAWLGALTATTHCFSLASTVVLTRGLTPPGYGALAFALAVASYQILVGSLGVKPLVVRDGVRQPDKLGQLFGAHTLVTAASAGAVCLSSVTACFLVPLEPTERAALLLVSIGSLFACLDIVPFFDVAARPGKAAVVTLAVEAASLAVLLVLFQAGLLTPPRAAGVFAGKWAGNTLAHYAVYPWKVRPLRLAGSAAAAARLARSSWPLMAAALLSGVPFSAGVVWVRWVHGPADAALMSVAGQGATAYLMLMAIGTRVLQPHMAGTAGLEGRTVRAVFLLSAVMLSLLLGATLVAGFAALPLLGPGYLAARSPLGLMLTAAFVHSLGAVGGTYLVSWGGERGVMLANAVTSLTYVAGGLFLVPRYSFGGAATATLAASTLGTVLVTVMFAARRTELIAARPPMGVHGDSGPVLG